MRKGLMLLKSRGCRESARRVKSHRPHSFLPNGDDVAFAVFSFFNFFNGNHGERAG